MRYPPRALPNTPNEDYAVPSALPFEPESRSLRGDVATSLTFVNRADEPADVHWVDYRGEAHQYRTLAPGDTWTISTFETHAWVVTGASSGRFLARAIGHAQPHTVIIKQRDRTRVDRPDEQTGFQIQALYVLPADGTDHFLDVNGTLPTSGDGWKGWFAGQTGGTKLRGDTHDGEPDIVYVRLEATAAEVRANTHRIADALRERGFDQPNKIYAIYYDGPNDICGDGSSAKGVATVYLQGDLCPGEVFTSTAAHPGYWSFVMMHELLHALGCVPPCAPNVSRERPAHVDDHPQDIMYYLSATHPLILDVGRDDYYGHGREDCFDLARSPFLDPLPDRVALPLRWRIHLAEKYLAAHPRAVRVRSARAGAEMHLNLINRTGHDVLLFFIDSGGKARYYAHLAHNAQVTQHTYAGHAWILIVVDNDERATVLRQWVADARDASITLG